MNKKWFIKLFMCCFSLIIVAGCGEVKVIETQFYLIGEERVKGNTFETTVATTARTMTEYIYVSKQLKEEFEEYNYDEVRFVVREEGETEEYYGNEKGMIIIPFTEQAKVNLGLESDEEFLINIEGI